ncbi:MAG: PepSY domain-containing protein [Sulfuricurvum sp.]|uniref:PepSY domain-containing protein n=1 Tax=Sulfuricurvum sp. TaxID=2025608 RepID=UPI0026388FCD|nr:PepSY domain-containing protein [Sulfuricurvum sp.]MDD2949238.1 PepSY domain-containing protein [Sulfuricurvum sp.]MDD5119194.1 PepSY domain-containing protein [Sulfuricurvum sp.]
MKRIFFICLTFLSVSLYGAMGSSVTIPTQEHMKYTFGNHRNHLVKSMEEHQYYKSMAPMNEEDIRKHLSDEGYGVRGVKLRDIASELVYQVYATDSTAKDIKLYVDPANGSILKMEPIQ